MAGFVFGAESQEGSPTLADGRRAGGLSGRRHASGREAAASALLEYLPNTVTASASPPGRLFEVAKCRCDCWFCADCCKVKGYGLRRELIPILETFGGLMMLTFTVDPSLFATPKAAYLYIRKRRCIGRTLQDLDRAGFLHSRRYFYVVEFQRETEQAHFHVLVDASFIPFGSLLASWAKHRPASAGPVVGNRPAFGTVLFSKRDFNGPVHAARYATKYLVKMPEQDFPAWVLAMGTKQRVRRYSTSRGFWKRASQPRREPESTRQLTHRSYEQRRKDCGQAIQLLEASEYVDPATGEVTVNRRWIGKLDADASILDKITDAGDPRRRRRWLPAPSLTQALAILGNAAGRPVSWLHVSQRSLAAGVMP